MCRALLNTLEWIKRNGIKHIDYRKVESMVLFTKNYQMIFMMQTFCQIAKNQLLETLPVTFLGQITKQIFLDWWFVEHWLIL